VNRPRVRIVRFVVSIEAVVDDGENLTPLPINPVPYAAADAALFDLGHIREVLQRQVDVGELPAETPADAPAET
jgi:hypothetical protein